MRDKSTMIVIRELRLEFAEEDFMSRCAVCNSKGFRRVTRAEVAGRPEVKPKVGVVEPKGKKGEKVVGSCLR
jgi:hypothetical protein